MPRKRIRQSQPSKGSQPTRSTPKKSKLEMSTSTTASSFGQRKLSKWIILALASGLFAALNGVFAKLTTTELTGNIARGISHSLSMPESWDKAVEYLIRALFFGLNLLSNITMWALFTRALTASPSTTQVSITNTTANFLTTAMLGMVVFGEKVAGLWWVGATAMAGGCIIVGMREEGDGKKGAGSATGREYGQGEEEDILLGSDEEEEEEERGEEGGRAGRRQELI